MEGKHSSQKKYYFEAIYSTGKKEIFTGYFDTRELAIKWENQNGMFWKQQGLILVLKELDI